MTAYYNEWDKPAAAWLRELIKQGLIADGVVDERSITDIKANDLRGFSQCHFFAGIGGWSYALRLANWSDNRPVWTASLPCQPFSVAGNQKGKEDERHLLPHFLELVRQCGPDTILGEQVEGAVKHGWLDDLHTAMEAEDYTVGAAVLGAHSVNAPHTRQRLYWVASRLSDTRSKRQQGQRQVGRSSDSTAGIYRKVDRAINDGRLNDSGLGNSKHNGPIAAKIKRSNATAICSSEKRANSTSELTRTGPSRALSAECSNIEWIYCRDGKHRPILAGLKPVLPTKSCVKSLASRLSSGVGYSSSDSIQNATAKNEKSSYERQAELSINPNETQEARVMRLRGYGNSIVPSVGAEFIKAFMAVQNEQ